MLSTKIGGPRQEFTLYIFFFYGKIKKILKWGKALMPCSSLKKSELQMALTSLSILLSFNVLSIVPKFSVQFH